MTLPITPGSIAASYDYIATTPPFSGWNLPDSETSCSSVASPLPCDAFSFDAWSKI
jgi:hypothetical protein